MRLTYRLRKNRNQVECVAPFIFGSNVWDIPKKFWCESVQKAIAHSYELGYKAAMDDVRTLTPPRLLNAEWEEKK